MPARAQACSIVVGCHLPCQSGISLGTSISRPSTLILIFSTGGGAGLVSVVVVGDILFNAKAQRRRGAGKLCAFASSKRRLRQTTRLVRPFEEWSQLSH